MKIQVITSCTGEKRHSAPNQLVQEDFHRRWESTTFQARERSLSELALPAEDMYTGQQHVRVMAGVQKLRQSLGVDAIDVKILSAGYGLISSKRRIVPYECTFKGMKAGELRAWADYLRVPEAMQKAFATAANFTSVLLGDSYLRAINFHSSIEFKSPTLFFTSEESARFVQGHGKFRVVTLANLDAKTFSCGLVGLKGELGKRLLSRIAAEGDVFIASLFDPTNDVLALLATAEGATATRTKKVARANPTVDRVIEIPQSWWAKPHREKLRYFIPEWDDLVDPDYDFESDTHSGGTGDWANEVYAHQMYPEPNYDGILVSRAVAEKSKKKDARINSMGVHRFLRVPRTFPIMGDCGAFDYIEQKVPPYTTTEVIDYYTRLGFDYGVSVDHLIVPAFYEDKQFRYDLTLQNGEDFIKEHHNRGLTWEPIGAVQGWDPKSYSDAAAAYTKMGYQYLALGGLVRSQTREILRTVEAVRKVIPPNTKLHVLGFARFSALREIVRLGVNSIDSASMLRKAWLGAKLNYLTINGWYSAVRIPQSEGSFRAKRLTERAAVTPEKLIALEQACLREIRVYAGGRGHVPDSLVQLLYEYDALVAGNRPGTVSTIRRTLEDRPWDQCGCAICRRWGIEVLIFRGNNRNRRRGFHNTYMFYQLLEKIIHGERLSWLEGDQFDLPIDEVLVA